MSPETERAEALLAAGGASPEHVPRLAQYAALVLDANRKFNLTGARTIDEFVPHILDSLTVVPYIRTPYVDVGSGGGLPGIPVAIVTGARTLLVEATAKKAAFLREAISALGIDAEVATARAEDAGRKPELRQQFVTATARAVATAPTALELTAPLLAVGGVAILQRGSMDVTERTALEGAALMLGCVVDAEVALEGERRLILVRKTSATPERFPRRAGIPEKRPLCSLNVPRGTLGAII
ncbi:MAG TPA: 16S rRNA (guanine(527)-N(7))-methyltransferase RsmG [Candidatus Rubrimentiphilum sp.]|nr:16S rRNA (guanine(527)-N(7))-methyltransferase RsmG [Candidatus Rubrimentiphilum sp.]